MRGPINGRVDMGCGFLYTGFHIAPSILDSYSPKFYIEFARKNGMKKSRDLLTVYLDFTQQIPTSLLQMVEACKLKHVRILGFQGVCLLIIYFGMTPSVFI